MHFYLAALADFTGVIVHGVIGYSILIAPLRTHPTQAFGDEDISRRIFIVAWHLVTAVFFISGVAFVGLALGRLSGQWLPRFIGALHGSFALVALAVVRGRLLEVVRRPVPIAFFSVMTTVAVLGWW
jgi:hypothetical protein